MQIRKLLGTNDVKTFGYSMYPLLINGDIVRYRKKKFSKIKTDDLIGFIRKNQIINHRVIYKGANYLITKGDNNLLQDKKVNPKDIIGEIVNITRNNQIIYPENIYLLQSLNYFAEIVKVKNLLEVKKVDYVLLKGLPVNLYYVKSHPRRIYADCDILIDGQYLGKVNDLLLSLGYKKEESKLIPYMDKFLKKKPEISYTKNTKNFRITFDIHLVAVFLLVQTSNLWPLYPPNKIKEFSKLLLSEKKVVTVEKNKFQVLSSELQIIYLALHLFHDNFRGYYKYLFLEYVINSSNINEKQIIDVIKEYKMENFVYPVFKLLLKYYHPKLSKSFILQIKPRQVLKQEDNKIYQSNIFQDDGRINTGIRRFKNIYYLSPTNPILKPFVFLNPEVLLLTFFAIIIKLTVILKSRFVYVSSNVGKIDDSR